MRSSASAIFSFFGAKRNPDIPAAVTAEDKSRRNEDPCFVQNLLRELFHIVATFRDASPKEHAHLRRVESAAQRVHDFFGQCPSFGVHMYVGLFVPLGVVPVSGSGGELHRAEGSRVDIALHFKNPFHEFRVRGQHAHTPARHVVALAHRVELDATAFGTGDLQDAEAFVVQNEAVWVVVHDDKVVAQGKVYQFFVRLASGVGTRRHVGIVGPHGFSRPSGPFLPRL